MCELTASDLLRARADVLFQEAIEDFLFYCLAEQASVPCRRSDRRRHRGALRDDDVTVVGSLEFLQRGLLDLGQIRCVPDDDVTCSSECTSRPSAGTAAPANTHLQLPTTGGCRRRAGSPGRRSGFVIRSRSRSWIALGVHAAAVRAARSSASPCRSRNTYTATALGTTVTRPIVPSGRRQTSRRYRTRSAALARSRPVGAAGLSCRGLGAAVAAAVVGSDAFSSSRSRSAGAPPASRQGSTRRHVGHLGNAVLNLWVRAVVPTAVRNGVGPACV